MSGAAVVGAGGARTLGYLRPVVVTLKSLLLHGDQIRNILGERAEIDGQLSEKIAFSLVGGQSSNEFAVRGILAQLLQFRAEVTQIIHDEITQ